MADLIWVIILFTVLALYAAPEEIGKAVAKVKQGYEQQFEEVE